LGSLSVGRPAVLLNLRPRKFGQDALAERYRRNAANCLPRAYSLVTRKPPALAILACRSSWVMDSARE
jgi:hypothetical protein